MKYIAKKTGILLVTLLGISIITFFAFSILPGDASLSKLGTEASPERIEETKKELGLNESIPVRYGKWLKKVIKGDFGESYQYKGTSVNQLLFERLKVTALLTLLSFFLIFAISIPLGVFQGRHNSRIITLITKLSMAIPPFFLGIILTFLLGIVLSLFTPGAFVFPEENFFQCVYYLLLPAVSIAIPKIAMVVSLLASSIKGEMKMPYVRTAFSKGLKKNQVFYGHILRNATIPVMTFLALMLADILAGSVIIEQVFSVPGIGRLLVTAISNRDFPIVQAIVLVLTGFVVILNALVDVLYHIIDPRIKK